MHIACIDAAHYSFFSRFPQHTFIFVDATSKTFTLASGIVGRNEL